MQANMLAGEYRGNTIYLHMATRSFFSFYIRKGQEKEHQLVFLNHSHFLQCPSDILGTWCFKQSNMQ